MKNRTGNSAGEAKAAEAPKQKARWRWWGKWFLIVVLVLLVTGELMARLVLGLGDPPLSQADPEIEYLFKPDQDCRRLGHRIKYNHYSMRSDDFPEHKTDRNELRVLVVGDSVVNGGGADGSIGAGDGDSQAQAFRRSEAAGRVGEHFGGELGAAQ